jgi:ribosomal protein S18 acetylase RimI-like enzyme
MQFHNMNASDLYDSNIQNLTDLWRAMGAKAMEPDTGPVLHASPSWPDRLWFGVAAQLERADILRLIDAARDAARPVTLPVWCKDESDLSRQARPTSGLSLARELGANRYKVAFEQTVMALDMAQWNSEPASGTEVELQRVEGKTADWADVASRSFGYTVPAAVTERLVENSGVSLMIARTDDRLVGTGLVYAEGDVAGLHMVGVVPEARRMGVARTIMMRLLDDVRSRGFGIATLQSSDMGEGLYRELGFGSQGRIRNFQLQ